ncbi:uncharacterized protein [Venturia canescens]|uniref:uncharacterized protein n=1 Tax=Venturia canescens TaxID=32260 RepID=UPI001C9BFADF|nr:uncharacterized protein LOC122412339 [Venturia canescens]
MQCQQYYCFPSNQQGGALGPNQYVQPYQQDPYGISQQQQPIQRAGLGNVGQALAQTSYNGPSIMQPQAVGYGSLPFASLDQIRSYIGTPAPIFILPSNCPNPGSQPAAPANPPVAQGCPGIGINCPSSPVHGCLGGGCYPFPVPMGPLWSPYYQQPGNAIGKETRNCGCCPRKSVTQEAQPTSRSLAGYQWGSEGEEHRCAGTTDDTICSRKNCPSAINLQALASQLLAIPGVIPCAATRIVLRKIPGGNVTTSMEETVERAKRSLVTLTKDQLLAESRAAQQVNALINLHMSANPPINVIPTLTSLQLKINLLKSQVEASLNRRLSENQGLGAEGAGNLDAVMLATKSDEELRGLLGTLRKKECDERVNLNFAPYKSQRSIAESRLTNVQNKIAQIEEEMDRRRASVLPRSAMGHQVSQQLSDPGCAAWYGYTGDPTNGNWTTSSLPQNYESPDPFRAVQVRNPKRLNLKPHVGSPETTYENSTNSSNAHSSRSRKDSDEEDCDDRDERSKRSATSPDDRCCHCDKSSDEDSVDEGKKKLGVKIHAPDATDRNELRANSPVNSAVSVLKLSPNVTIVIDNCTRESSKISRRCNLGCKENHENGGAKVALKKNSSLAEPRGFVGPSQENRDRKSFLPSAPPPSPLAESREERKTFKGAMKKFKSRDQKVKEAAASPALLNSKSPDKEERVDYNISTVENSGNKPEYNANKMAEILDKVEDKKYKNPPTTIPPSDSEAPVESQDPPAELIREETVRMVTEIQYEPTAFRAFDYNDARKGKIIEERYKAPPFAEECSLKSTSTESNLTNESVSLRVENYEETPIEPAQRLNSIKNPEPFDHEGSCMKKCERTDAAQKIDKNRAIPSETRLDKMENNGEKRSEEGRKDVLRGVEESEGRSDLISGALSTIGNHVASFGSIIGKIATLKLHNRGESADEILSDEKTKISEHIEEARKNESSIGSRNGGETSKMKNEGNKTEIGRWKYIRFSDVQESTNTSVEDLNSNHATYTLPKIKHSVIESKNGGGKFVVVEKPSKTNKSHELGEPYKTGRSLVIRSRLKSPQTDKQPGPFTVVRGPRKKDKNCIALSLANVKSLAKNRLTTANAIKTSDKFWLKPETSESSKDVAGSSKVTKFFNSSIENDCDNHDRSLNNDPQNPSNLTCIDESVVTVHDYAKIRFNPQTQIIPQPSKPRN